MCDYLTEISKIAQRYHSCIILVSKKEYETVRLIGQHVRLDTLIAMINEEFTCPEQKLYVETRKNGRLALESGTDKIWYNHFVYELQVKPKYEIPNPVVYHIIIE